MTIATGQNAEAGDFIQASEINTTSSADNGKVPQLEADGRISTAFMRFGGDGSDGALVITSGTTTVDCAGAQIVVKNYSSISITGTGKLAFSNPHENGTIIILKCRGACVLTSSNVPLIDLKGMGADGGDNTDSGENGASPTGLIVDGAVYGASGGDAVGGVGGIQYSSSYLYTDTDVRFHSSRGRINLVCGAGGGSGRKGSAQSAGQNSGAVGGRGGGGLLIECAGDLNFTGTIDSSGSAGGDANDDSSGNAAGGAGGGGSAGLVVIIYNSATATSGTITATGGAGGAGGDATGSTGTAGGGGGGGGSKTAAGGAGGSSNTAGSNGTGTGAGGGGGGGRDGVGSGGAGGSAGATMGGFVVKNTYIA